MREIELYQPMAKWLRRRLEFKYPDSEVIVIDSHSKRLDKVLFENDINYPIAIGLDIQIDVLGIVRSEKDIKLFFIEAKKDSLTLKDLGQLWGYCKLINPEEAYLLSSKGLGILGKLMKVYNREDLLDYGNKQELKKIYIAKWDIIANNINFMSVIPKI